MIATLRLEKLAKCHRPSQTVNSASVLTGQRQVSIGDFS